MQLHSTYVQRRQPGVPYREFQRLWRSHGDFASTVPAFWRNVERYIHNDPVEDPSGLPVSLPEHDAIGELYYASVEAWAGMRDVMWNQVAPDEKRVFAGAPLAVRGTRRIVQAPAGPYKLFTLGKYHQDGTPEESVRQIEEYVDFVARLESFSRALRGFTITTASRLPADLAMDRVPQTSSTHDLLVIFHFETERSARVALTGLDYSKLAVRESEFLNWESRLTLLCREWVLKGEAA